MTQKIKIFPNGWSVKRLRHFTLEDAMMALESGFHCICGDGNIVYLTNSENV